MVLNFDVKTFCQNLKATKPPYECPIQGCDRVYKSYSGIETHLYNFDHENPESTPCKKPNGSARKGRKSCQKVRQAGRSPSPPEFFRPARDTLTYAEAQRLVEIDLDGKIHRLNIYEPLEIIPQDEVDNCDNTEKEEKPEKPVTKAKETKVKAKGKESTKGRKDATAGAAVAKLPEASFKIIDDYVKPPEAPKRSHTYFRYFEKTNDELDDEIEYDMDEEVRSVCVY